jgi:3-phenylpropionate/trans-cinnamate dioxygenase ferredoxin reductase subunit
MSRKTFAVVGAGLAGAKAVEALRQEGFDGAIILVGAESELPYERPPLSKGYLRGETSRDEARVLPDDVYSSNDVTLRLGATVEELRPDAGELILAGGERIAFDRALIATGARPRRLELDGGELAGIHYLRDFGDADAISRRLESTAHVAVIGAGWIGAEVAASARQMGVEVTLIENAEVPLEHVLGREVGQVFSDLHRSHGVRLLSGRAVTAFEGGAALEAVRLSDDTVVAADFAVVGAGVVPNAELAKRSGIWVNNGIVTSESLRTNAPAIFAAGDVANAWHPFYRRRLRVEHWANALNQPATAARAMLGKRASYERLPYFFSDQYDLGMEYTGYATGDDEVVFRGDPAGGQFIAFWLRAGLVQAGMNVNVWDVTDQIQELIRSRSVVDVGKLVDVDEPLAAAVGRSGSDEVAA